MVYTDMDRFFQSIAREMATPDGGGTQAPSVDPLCPVELVENMGDNDLGDAAAGGHGRGAGTAVMDDGLHAGEEGGVGKGRAYEKILRLIE
jgi:hypothetical protein